MYLVSKFYLQVILLFIRRSLGNMSTNNDVLVDALPYIDQGYDEPGIKQAALALVDEECKRYKPNKNYLDFLGPINVHAFEVSTFK